MAFFVGATMINLLSRRKDKYNAVGLVFMQEGRCEGWVGRVRGRGTNKPAGGALRAYLFDMKSRIISVLFPDLITGCYMAIELFDLCL